MTSKYVIDANVLITAHRQYYAFDIVPSFWPKLVDLADKNIICSIKRVQEELLEGPKRKLSEPPDQLSSWAKNTFSPYFRNNDDNDVVQKYSEVMASVTAQDYSIQQIEFFADGADGWLIAYADVYGYKLVTLEKDKNTRKKVSIPKICEIIGVTYISTFEMLRELGVVIA